MNISSTELNRIYNYRSIGDKLGTGGQPSPDDFDLIHGSGFSVVINLALATSDKAIPNEGSIVTGLGMSYVHIPVDFKTPSAEAFRSFCGIMKAFEGQPVFVHCVANMRVSAFVFLYRVLFSGVSITDAERDLHAIWQPDEVWRQFIRHKLTTHEITAD